MFVLPTLPLALGCYKPPEHLGGTSGTRYGCSFCASAVQLDSCVSKQLAQNYLEGLFFFFLQGWVGEECLYLFAKVLFCLSRFLRDVIYVKPVV